MMVQSFFVSSILDEEILLLLLKQKNQLKNYDRYDLVYFSQSSSVVVYIVVSPIIPCI
jgi:hypothetical protein